MKKAILVLGLIIMASATFMQVEARPTHADSRICTQSYDKDGYLIRMKCVTEPIHGDSHKCIEFYDKERNLIGKTCVKASSDKSTESESWSTGGGSSVTITEETKIIESEVTETFHDE